MSHMEKQVEYGEWVEVETNNGTEVIPADLIDLAKLRIILASHEYVAARIQGLVKDYIEGSEVRSAEVVKGWGARMSAPGYMDCTPWSVYPTEQDAQDSLDDESDAPAGDYQVTVGNIGMVLSTGDKDEAIRSYAEYVEQSKSGIGRAGHEIVTLWEDGEISDEYRPEVAQDDEEDGERFDGLS